MKGVCFTILAFILVHISFAQTGSLDPSFGGTGYVKTSIGGMGLASKVLIQPDGKIIAAGVSYVNIVYLQNGDYYGTTIFSLVRYNSDGTLDQSFGISGKAQYINGTSPSFYDVKPSAAMQADGKILMSENILNTDSNYDFMLIRINTDGSLDTAFGTQGRVQSDDSAGFDYPVDIAVQQDGKIIEAGNTYDKTSNNYKLFMLRLSESGELDSTFGINGKVIRPGYIFARMRLLSSGKILLTDGLSLYRYNPDGSIDNTFSSSIYSPLQNTEADIFTMEIDTDGSTILGGASNNNFNTYFSLIAKANPLGAIDSSFNAVGYTIDSILSYSNIPSLAIQNDGKILTMNYASYNSLVNSIHLGALAVRRFNKVGTIDSTFGTDGLFILDTTVANIEYAASIAIQADGKVVALGSAYAGLVIFRLLNNLALGIVDFSSSTNTMQVYPNPISHQSTLSYELANNETISIGLYDMNGRIVEPIADNIYKPAGCYTQMVTISDNISAGNYILRLSNNNGSSNIKIEVK